MVTVNRRWWIERYWTGIPRFRRSLAYLLLGAAVGALVLSFAAVETVGRGWRLLHRPLHSTVEAVGALAAVAIGWFLLQRRRQDYTGRRFLLAVGFLGMGELDLFHAVTVPGCGFVLVHGVASLAGGSWLLLTWLPRRAADSEAAMEEVDAMGRRRGPVVGRVRHAGRGIARYLPPPLRRLSQ